LGLHADHLQGEIVHEENGLSLTLRTLSDAKIPAVRISKKGIEQLFQEGGAALLQLTNPSASAMFAYHKLNKSLSDFAVREANYKEAVRLFEYCLKYQPTAPLALYLWGSALNDLKRPEEAIKLYLKATDIDPYYVDAYYNWGNALQKLKRYKEAIEQYRMATNIDSKYASAYISWSKALKDLKRYKEAIEQYRKAIDTDPKAVDACNILEPCPPRSQASQGSDQ
jgi:tetratricopeptide (TPR) repeat protein